MNSYPGTLSLDLDSMWSRLTLCSLKIFRDSARAPTASVGAKMMLRDLGSFAFLSMMTPPSTTLC